MNRTFSIGAILVLSACAQPPSLDQTASIHNAAQSHDECVNQARNAPETLAVKNKLAGETATAAQLSDLSRPTSSEVAALKALDQLTQPCDRLAIQLFDSLKPQSSGSVRECITESNLQTGKMISGRLRWGDFNHRLMELHEACRRAISYGGSLTVFYSDPLMQKRLVPVHAQDNYPSMSTTDCDAYESSVSCTTMNY